MRREKRKFLTSGLRILCSGVKRAEQQKGRKTENMSRTAFMSSKLYREKYTMHV